MADARLRLEPSKRKRGLRGIIAKMAQNCNTHCCVPLCTQRGRVGPEGERIGFFKFPQEDKMKKKWIHAIRRDVGRFFVSPRHQKCVLYTLSQQTFRRVLEDVCLSKQALFLRFFPGKNVSSKASSPSRKAISTYQSLFSVPEILVDKTADHEAEFEIRKTGTNLKNDAATALGIAESSVYSIIEMSSTENKNNLRTIGVTRRKMHRPRKESFGFGR